MSLFADRVKDTSTTTGTGALTLANSAPTGFRTFASAFGSSSIEVGYCIVHGSEWEVGRGIFNGTTGLTRAVVLASSNAGAAVSLSSGSKDIFCTIPAQLLAPLQLDTFDDDVDLSNAGFGATMPETEITSDTTLTVKTGWVLYGYMAFIARGDGTHIIDDSNFFRIGGEYDPTEGARTKIECWMEHGDDTFPSILYTPMPAIPATGVLMDGPSDGTTGDASSAFNVTMNGSRLGAVVVTPDDASDGGTFDPTSVTLHNGETKSFAYTAATDGDKTISVTNDSGLDDPDPITYTAGGVTTLWEDDYAGYVGAMDGQEPNVSNVNGEAWYDPAISSTPQYGVESVGSTEGIMMEMGSNANWAATIRCVVIGEIWLGCKDSVAEFNHDVRTYDAFKFVRSTGVLTYHRLDPSFGDTEVSTVGTQTGVDGGEHEYTITVDDDAHTATFAIDGTPLGSAVTIRTASGRNDFRMLFGSDGAVLVHSKCLSA